ncbi:sensor histidine kinase [Nonomuraea sp. SMC257]|uniref:histidine kinase n=1 Tax=Nonomuraea montanisoli TaxID=2741721 RepID=A0A7Y6IEF5_9ACTN|nr:sensor histidine kinase [Nonomuraea montanisoli]NUW36718.1 sensor histidine kinase [Nonomuraea montanisoli]
MRRARSLRDMTGWVTFAGGRPPLAFHVFFWGSAVIAAVVFAVGLSAIRRIGADAGPLYEAFFVGGAAALPLACVLWPLLPWSPDASAARKGASVLFLGVSLLVMLAGGAAALLMAGLAVGNALVVLKLRGGVGYAVLAGLFQFAMSLLNPAQPFVAAVLNGATVTLVCLVILVVVDAMIEVNRRTEETARLLAELGEAHAELRRHADRARDLAVAEERARMARDMHDSVGHYLTVVNVGLANAQRYRTLRPDAAWDEVRQAQELTLEALADTRRWVRALRPLRMEGRTGIAALRALAESFRSADTDVTFTVTGGWPDIDESRELVCYRIVQEGLTNALRHSRARHVRVAVACTPDGVDVTVSDDGTGADPEAVVAGFGLNGLRERLHAVDGALELAADPGEGFTLRAVVPA